ncbi:hypothetical protein [Azohydromonas aeria]|uniref:hypothetical protein n=1 Tax=Azohydromonas aeria TaxID=2590212 RepID=UPI0012F995F0|nr:hypothetical protein [Azohydromonas aeria]
MRTSKGGTDMYCPRCKKIKTCKAISAAQVTMDTSDYAQRKYYTEHADIHFFQRGRLCLSCGHRFVSGEVDLEFLQELIELRDALKEIKSNAEMYTKQSAAAADSLSKLNNSLGVLKALKLYRKTGKRENLD